LNENLRLPLGRARSVFAKRECRLSNHCSADFSAGVRRHDALAIGVDIDRGDRDIWQVQRDLRIAEGS